MDNLRIDPTRAKINWQIHAPIPSERGNNETWGALIGHGAEHGIISRARGPARMLVDEGYESLWAPQAIGRGVMLIDPLLALATAAAVTDTVELGTAVLQVPLYHTSDLAHRVLSLHQLCGDRLSLGVGPGSTEHDFTAFGRDYSTRFRDFGAAMQQLRVPLASGKHGETDLTPWPTTRGGPRVLYGTWGAGVERAATAYDGWIASAHYRTPEEVVAALGRYREAGGKRAIVSTIQLPGGSDMGEVAQKLSWFAEAGFDDAVVFLLPGGPTPKEVRALVR